MSSEAPKTFADLGLSDAVIRAVDALGYETPTPIQAAAIPPLLEGRDILGQAQTGTGKTAAFALPLLSRIDPQHARPQILVLTPTRELAIQVAEALQSYARNLPGFHVLPVYGGQSMDIQLRALRRGVHAIVGTPGRVLDHLRRRTLPLDALAHIVLDEADEMLRMGFIDDVGAILEQAPANKQVALFSATLPVAIRSIARRHTRDAVEVRIESRTATVSTVTQRYWVVSGVHKLDALTRILEAEDFDAMAIFVRTKIATTELASRLEARGFSCAPLNGDMNQAAREQTIERLKAGRLDILVATDVAARGLDVDRISHVINYDVPHDTEAYVHRIGRTARAGRQGAAILFLAPRERRMLRSIERVIGQTLEPMSIPTQQDVVDRRASRFKSRITEVLESEDLAPYEALVNSYQFEHNVGLAEIAAALARLAQGDRPLVTPPGKPLHPVKERPESAPPQRQPAGQRRPTRTPVTEDHRPTHREPRTPKFEASIPTDTKLERYRIEVGAEHGVEPKNIVGAIANEAGLESRHIGAIDIHESFSTVELPTGLPRRILEHLSGVWVRGQQLKISTAHEERGHTPLKARPDRPPKHDGPAGARRGPRGPSAGPSSGRPSGGAPPDHAKPKTKKKDKGREKVKPKKDRARAKTKPPGTDQGPS